MVKSKRMPARESPLSIKGPKKDVLRQLPQVPNTKSKSRDAMRTARLPGKRVSKTGNEYWETRSNRSDKRPKNPIGSRL